MASRRSELFTEQDDQLAKAVNDIVHFTMAISNRTARELTQRQRTAIIVARNFLQKEAPYGEVTAALQHEDQQTQAG